MGLRILGRNKIGKFGLCQRQEPYRGLTAEPAVQISGNDL
jgi:hypothetical protein